MASSRRVSAEANGSLSVSNQDNGTTLPDSYPSFFQKYTSRRWSIGYMMVLAFVLVQSLENCMSFALVCMTREITQEPDFNHTVITSQETYPNIWNTTMSSNMSSNGGKTIPGEFSYTSEMQGLFISSPFYAGIISPIFGSLASRRFGPKRVIFFCMLLGGTMEILVPLSARTKDYLVVICRIIMGFALNMILPASLDIWLYWSPAREKAQMVTYSFAGFNMANIVTFLICGFLCVIPIDNGWPFIFYVFGGCAVIWCLAWLAIVYDKPELQPSISHEEKSYIFQHRTNVDNDRKDSHIPWKSMVSSVPVWAYWAVMFFHAWNSSVLFSYLPTYMATVLNFDVEQNGALSSLPYVTRVMGTVGWSIISIQLMKVISMTHTRKLIQTIGYTVSAALTIGLCFLEDGQEYIAVAMFALTTPFTAAAVSAAIVSPVDLAPQYASVMTSAGIAFSQMAMSTAPVVVSYIIPEKTRDQWASVFYMNAAVYFIGALTYLIFGSGEIQPWADNSVEKNDVEAPRSRKQSEVNAGYINDADEMSKM
ncbi:uncharacterized transporter slc-17.2-like [Haliotis rufescens]|uniref:uncharacterized transporter slc-17.2-like n=1 Tax=Haliotis rufescens TaxID=6454 RepID=UPI00201F6F94|nr:uncharacterized transporter slc-17.2-like [Haliotis rufescens]